tara:strand:- start:953 stop:1564 length:612 start_codon:yes stop_codon:yes gene_type:complete
MCNNFEFTDKIDEYISNYNKLMNKAVFLDRDGVINKIFKKNGLPFSPPNFEQFEILPGVKESIIKFKKLNFYSIIITNQPDVSRGKIKKKTVLKMNDHIKKEIKIDDIFVCFHDDHDNCDCRKPKPGLIHNAIKKWNININKSFMIGDRKKDIDAGKSAGCKTIFLDYNYNEAKPDKPDFITNTLLDAALIIEKDLITNENKK